MASGDALGEASASASQKGNPETHDDLLREVHFEENDLPMFNLQGELLGDEVHIEENDQPMLDFRGDSTQSYHTPPVAVMVNPQASKVPTIKIEALEGPFISELTVNTIDDPIEISDTEDLDHTCEHDFKMLDGVVPSDKEVLEEITILDAESTPVPIKKEDDEVEFLWEKMDDRVIELDSDDEPSTASQPNLGKSFLKGLDPEGKRRSIDSAAMRRAQEAHLQVLRRRHGIPEPSATRGILPGLGLQGPKSGDDFVWMQEVVNLDDGPLTDFRAVKQEYKAKRKARKNTMEDDVQYKKAHMENSQRVKRLAQEAADTDSDDEAEESDDGLFVSQQRYSHSKRPFSSMMDVNDDDDDDDDDDEGVVPVEKPNSKRPKTVQANISTKKSRARALQKELKSNMLAGIEPHLLRDQKRVEDRRAAEAETVHTGGKKSSKKSKAPDLSAKRTKTGRMNNIGSLVTSNLYEDSNANLDRQALPVVTEKKKKEFLSSLIANIPLEDKKQANADRIDVLRASALLGSRKVFPDGQGNWTFKGMKSSLYHYQLSGAAYMKMREQGEQNPYGGILADEMGLGKTVMMIACMLANRQTDPEEPKCTLIVCSPALIGQWRAELDLHVEDNVFQRIGRHHAHQHFNGKGAEAEMERADVILTTYGEVVKSYPKCEVPKDLKTPAEKEAWWSMEWDEKRGLLHRARFYRVVLDEAQVIKNHHSQTSIACRALMAKHRWAISGTPIQNRLDELFPYFKFLRVRHTGSIGVFRQNFCLKDSDICNKRLHSFLDGMMIRRTHQDKILGAPLVVLPRNTQETLQLKFNHVERLIYEKVERKCIKAINAVAKDGTLEEKQRMIIIYFQRLRQSTAHIFMTQEVLQNDKYFGVSDIEAMRAELFPNATDISTTEDQMLNGLKKMIAEKDIDIDTSDTVSLFSDPDEPVQVPKAGKKSSNLTSRFSTSLKTLKKNANWSELRQRTLCHTCGESPEEPWVTSCLHLYCKECLTNLAYEASELDQDQTACHQCGSIFTESQPCEGMKELEVRDLSASVFQGDKDKVPEKKKFKLTMKYVDSKEYGLVPSTKTLAVKAQLEKWIRDDPERKIIVFTEWFMVMHVLSKICQEEGWKCCHYNGKLSYKAREESLNAFRDPRSGVKVLIASLKCGGTGLNLTAANKVLCLDLWFNACIEQQAFARVHRIGQKEETYITRFVVEDTVDQRLMKMQEDKKEIISTAMDDRSILANLTLPELLKLFGPVAYDENSKPFILVDDEHPISSNQGEDSAN